MGLFAAATTRAKTSTSTLAAPARNSARAGFHRRARCQHVIHQHKSAAGDRRLALVRNTEGALHIAGALGLREPDLMRGRFHPFERGMQYRNIGRRRHGLRQ